MAHLVWLQLDLFPHGVSSRYARVDDSERDRRTGGQWTRSILAYLNFRTGDPWRRLTSVADRESPARLWYLNGIREINNLSTGQLEHSPAITQKITQRDSAIAELARHPRAWLVAALLRSDPALTDRKLLSHLSTLKLATMIAAARAAGRAVAAA